MTTTPPPSDASPLADPPDPAGPTAPDRPATGRPAWPPITAILALFAALAAAVAAGLVIAVIGVIFGADPQDAPPAIAIGSTVVQDLCFVGAAVLFSRAYGTGQPWQLGLRPTRLWTGIGWAGLAFVTLVLFSAGFNALIGQKDAESLPPELGVDQSTAALVGTAVLVTVLAPLAEELLFRGYIFPALRNWRGTVPAVVIAGAIFGLLHVFSSPAYALVPLALFGSLLCLVYLKTRSLYPAIALHSVNNSIAFGSAPEVDWTWQIAPLAAGALLVIAFVALTVRRAFGAAPPALSPV